MAPLPVVLPATTPWLAWVAISRRARQPFSELKSILARSGVAPQYEGEFSTREGVAILARRIEKFWQRKEVDTVHVRIEPTHGVLKSYRESHYQVRSNLVNGLPAQASRGN